MVFFSTKIEFKLNCTYSLTGIDKLVMYSKTYKYILYTKYIILNINNDFNRCKSIDISPFKNNALDVLKY